MCAYINTMFIYGRWPIINMSKANCSSFAFIIFSLAVISRANRDNIYSRKIFDYYILIHYFYPLEIHRFVK